MLATYLISFSCSSSLTHLFIWIKHQCNWLKILSFPNLFWNIWNILVSSYTFSLHQIMTVLLQLSETFSLLMLPIPSHTFLWFTEEPFPFLFFYSDILSFNLTCVPNFQEHFSTSINHCYRSNFYMIMKGFFKTTLWSECASHS